MKKLSLLALLACSVSSAAITRINTARASDISGSNIASIDTGTFDSTAGYTEIVFVSWFNNAPNPTTAPVTDLDGNTYNLANCATLASTAKICAYVAHLATTSTGTNKITATFTGTGLYVVVTALQYAGIVSSSETDVVLPATDSFNSSLTTTGFSTSQANEVLIFGARNGGGVGLSYTAGGLYTIRLSDADGVTAVEDLIVPSTQSSASASISCTTSAGWLGVFVSLKAATVAAAGPKINISIQ